MFTLHSLKSRAIATVSVMVLAGMLVVPTGVLAGTSQAAASTGGGSPSLASVNVPRLAINGPIICSFQTFNGHYLTAVGGGGRTTDVIHTDAVRVGSWERFKSLA